MSKRKVYKVCIVGGGPAGMSVLVRATRLGYLKELLSSDETKDTLGVALLHGESLEKVGRGNLGEYVSNTNTFAKHFISNIIDDRLQLNPPECATNTVLEQLRSDPCTIKLEKYGSGPAPLRLVGDFLHVVGTVLVKELEKHPETCVFRENTIVNSIQIMSDGLIKVTTQKKQSKTSQYENDQKSIPPAPTSLELSIPPDHIPLGIEKMNGPDPDPDVVSVDDDVSVNQEEFYCEKVVLATGGLQIIPDLENPAHQEKLFLSDYVLRDEGLQDLKSRLDRLNSNKVCIVGGSHSGFSVAWTLLHKMENNSSEAACHQSFKRKEEEFTRIRKTSIIGNNHENTTTTTPTIPTTIATAAESGILEGTCHQMEGKVRKLREFGNRDISILHREPIKLYVPPKRAEEDGKVTGDSSAINIFTGLRADAKKLYKKIQDNEERRIKLFQAKTGGGKAIRQKLYDEAAAIVWCCGYATNTVSLYDSYHKGIPIVNAKGVVDLDNSGRILKLCGGKKIKLDNVFGIGIGYGLQSIAKENDEHVRADGVAVYERRGASLVLAAIFGNKIFGGFSSWKQYLEKNERLRHICEPPRSIAMQQEAMMRLSIGNTSKILPTLSPQTMDLCVSQHMGPSIPTPTTGLVSIHSRISEVRTKYLLRKDSKRKNSSVDGISKICPSSMEISKTQHTLEPMIVQCNRKTLTSVPQLLKKTSNSSST